jgi:cystathionine beta-lyase
MPAQFFRSSARVAMVDGSECGTAGAGFVRLNFATPRPILTRMLEQMGAAVRDR